MAPVQSSPPRSPAPAVLWLLAFVAVVSHLPAVGFDFAQDDFAGLARAAGILDVEGWPPRLWTSTVTWSALWPAFGSDPGPYHGLSLILLLGIAVFAARLAHRLGAGDAGAAVTGFLTLLGPTTVLPVAWVSAAAELWAVLFALVALDLWITPGRGIRPLAAGVAAALSVLSKEPALGLFLLLPLASRWFVDEEPAPTRRGRALVVTALAVLAVIGALQIRSAFAHGPGDPYALGGVADVAGNLLRSLGWAVWPWPGSIPPGWLARILGGMVLAVVGVLAVRRARRDDPRVLFLGLLALVSLAPTVVLRDHQYTYYALLANVAVAAIFGLEIGPRIDRRLRSTTPRGAALVGASVLVGAASIVGVSARVHARGEDGLLVDPILRRSSIVADVRAQISDLRRARPSPTAIGVLQAARTADPPDPEASRDRLVFIGTPIYLSLQGDRGLGILSGERLDARWIGHIDDVPGGGFVFLDAGDAVLRPLGPPDNARIYAAMIAVAGGQFARARHELWSVISEQGTRVRFAFDPANLPIRPEELDAEAPVFARELAEAAEADPTDGRILRLFEQIYEQVRGRELVRDLDVPLRAPRFDQ